MLFELRASFSIILRIKMNCKEWFIGSVFGKMQWSKYKIDEGLRFVSPRFCKVLEGDLLINNRAHHCLIYKKAISSDRYGIRRQSMCSLHHNPFLNCPGKFSTRVKEQKKEVKVDHAPATVCQICLAQGSFSQAAIQCCKRSEIRFEGSKSTVKSKYTESIQRRLISFLEVPRNALLILSNWNHLTAGPSIVSCCICASIQQSK